MGFFFAATDAAHYITKLPEAEHDAEEWQAAMEALLLIVTLGGPTMFAQIGVMRALNRHIEPCSIQIAKVLSGSSLATGDLSVPSLTWNASIQLNKRVRLPRHVGRATVVSPIIGPGPRWRSRLAIIFSWGVRPNPCGIKPRLAYDRFSELRPEIAC